jgi:MoxR-like ATPase
MPSVTAALSTDELDAARQTLAEVRRSVADVFIGDLAPVDMLFVSLLARGHMLLEGVPGVAKTTLVKAFAVALGCSVRRIQFTPDLLPADITGTYVLNPKNGDFSFRAGPIFANVVLADEINRAPAKTQSALLEAMQEGQVTVDGQRFELPQPFVVLATQNPLDLEGTYPLPEAQVDRFLVQVRLGYPSRADEVRMLRAHGVATPEARTILTPLALQRLQSVAARIHVDEDLFEYAVSLSEYTRNHAKVLLGASPRASLGLLRAAKGHAVLSGRAYLTPDDVRAVAGAVLTHRLVVVSELEDEASVRAGVVAAALRDVRYRRSVRPV